MPQPETIQREVEDEYAAAESALSNGNISAYISSRMQIWTLCDRLDKETGALQKTRLGDRALSQNEGSGLEALLQHLGSAQAKLDEHIVQVWNDEWNKELQAHLTANPHRPAFKPKRIASEDPRYGLGNVNVTREEHLLALACLKAHMAAREEKETGADNEHESS
jgi:hypothetical protein